MIVIAVFFKEGITAASAVYPMPGFVSVYEFGIFRTLYGIRTIAAFYNVITGLSSVQIEIVVFVISITAIITLNSV